MIILPNQNLSLLRSRDPVMLECEYCHKTFTKNKNRVHVLLKAQSEGRKIESALKYCSKECHRLSKYTGVVVRCDICGKDTYKTKRDMRKTKSGKLFCSHSCAGTYSNTHKTKGIRRSKLESWIEDRLKILVPHLTILYNDKQTIGSELDVYIPSLKLAFELNGIHHKKPIYGIEKLSQIQLNDADKSNKCLDAGILLKVIDTSSQRHFDPNTSEHYLKLIIDEIQKT